MKCARTPRDRNHSSSNGSRQRIASLVRRHFRIRHGAHAQSCGATKFTTREPPAEPRPCCFIHEAMCQFAAGLSTGTCTSTGLTAAHARIFATMRRTSEIFFNPTSVMAPSRAVSPAISHPAARILGPPQPTTRTSGASARNARTKGAAWASPEGSNAVTRTVGTCAA